MEALARPAIGKYDAKAAQLCGIVQRPFRITCHHRLRKRAFPFFPSRSWLNPTFYNFRIQFGQFSATPDTENRPVLAPLGIPLSLRFTPVRNQRNKGMGTRSKGKVKKINCITVM